ncbi:DNA-binding protein [Cupriavidus basilensis]
MQNPGDTIWRGLALPYEVVAAAADALLAEGRKVTLAAVRERIGTGSMNTIHRHWTIWQGHQKPSARKLAGAKYAAAFCAGF